MIISFTWYYFFIEKKSKRSNKDDGGEEERIDLPLGDDIDSAISRRKGGDKEEVKAVQYTAMASKKSASKPRKKWATVSWTAQLMFHVC